MRGCDHRPLAAYLPFSQVLFDTSSGKFERTERPTCPINTPPWLTRVNNNTVANLSSCRPSPTAITVKNLLQVYKHLRSFPASKLPRYVFAGFFFVVFLLVFLTSWRHTCLLTSSWWGWRKPKVCRMNRGKEKEKKKRVWHRAKKERDFRTSRETEAATAKPSSVDDQEEWTQSLKSISTPFVSPLLFTGYRLLSLILFRFQVAMQGRNRV